MANATLGIKLLIIGVALVTQISIYADGAQSDWSLPKPQQISPHVYAWIGPLDPPTKANQGFRMNMAFIIGGSAVAVIDSGYTRVMAESMIDHIKAITNLPISYVVNTNSQPHRFMGNGVFIDAGAEVIALPQSVDRMVKRGESFASSIEGILELKPGSVKVPLTPSNTNRFPRSLDLGKLKITLHDFGAAHTPAQLVVEIPGDNLVCAGDILYAQRLLAILPDSEIAHWLTAYANLAQFKNATFIPGHGSPAKLGAFDFPTRDYLQLVYNHMTKMVEQGVDVQDAINNLDQSAFKSLANFEEVAGRNASWAYLQIESSMFQ